MAVSNSNAAFGRSAGGQYTFVTKRGTNAVHGSLYENHQNDGLSANSWTNNRLALPKPPLRDNRFGGSIGGPLLRNKTFFFGLYEGRRLATSTSATRLVPTDSLKQGLLRFRDAAGAVQTIDLRPLDPRGLGASPVVLQMLQLYPAANNAGGDGLNTSAHTFDYPSRPGATSASCGSITRSRRTGRWMPRSRSTTTTRRPPTSCRWSRCVRRLAVLRRRLLFAVATLADGWATLTEGVWVAGWHRGCSCRRCSGRRTAVPVVPGRAPAAPSAALGGVARGGGDRRAGGGGRAGAGRARRRTRRRARQPGRGGRRRRPRGRRVGARVAQRRARGRLARGALPPRARRRAAAAQVVR